MNLFSSKSMEQEESHWLSVSDLMAGLMMVFLFIAVALMMRTQNIADSYGTPHLAHYLAKLSLKCALHSIYLLCYRLISITERLIGILSETT